MAVEAKEWYYTLRKVICQDDFAEPLREAALAHHLGQWTSLLTHAVVETCRSYSWVASAKEHETEVLPVPRQEYLGLDVIAFDKESPGSTSKWRLPIAVFELENREDEDFIAYSLWKVMAIRCSLRGVFCYQRQPGKVSALTASLVQVVDALEISHGEESPLLLVVGTRSKAGMFPDGFFQPYYWDKEWCRFRSLL
jgi:hypothetical protein